jgi:hypothetical protein
MVGEDFPDLGIQLTMIVDLVVLVLFLIGLVILPRLDH